MGKDPSTSPRGRPLTEGSEDVGPKSMDMGSIVPVVPVQVITAPGFSATGVRRRQKQRPDGRDHGPARPTRLDG
ncbi:hypothetical protein GCM10010977_15890 [Citricoccus zhacaiensis]|uniref:Uncharacterized protein n=1 Tax=Citricoccus zhacaiensis TaxID=489142 RepID=A0ABQ2LYL9_9MICC|nr:hypothetical protein GCM10010977_15890 [Citricoccus zhacaiensis]